MLGSRFASSPLSGTATRGQISAALLRPPQPLKCCLSLVWGRERNQLDPSGLPNASPLRTSVQARTNRAARPADKTGPMFLPGSTRRRTTAVMRPPRHSPACGLRGGGCKAWCVQPPEPWRIAATEIVGSFSMARALIKSSSVRAFGLPPFLPRARAAFNPARVRCRMISRSNRQNAR